LGLFGGFCAYRFGGTLATVFEALVVAQFLSLLHPHFSLSTILLNPLRFLRELCDLCGDSLLRINSPRRTVWTQRKSLSFSLRFLRELRDLCGEPNKLSTNYL